MNELIDHWEFTQQIKSTYPYDLDEAIDFVIDSLNLRKQITFVNEENFIGSNYSFAINSYCRTTFNLWIECIKNEEERSNIVKWFNKRGIYHPDDISGTIALSSFRRLTGRPINLSQQIKKYRKHWEMFMPEVNKGKLISE